MTPEELTRLEKVEEMLASLVANDRLTIQKHLQIFDARHIQLGKTNGTKFGTQTSQKAAFYGVTPVVQAAAIAAPTGGGSSSADAVDQSARARINDIRAALTNFGITA